MSLALLIYFHQGNIGKALLIRFNTFTPREQNRNVTFNGLSFFPPPKRGLGLSFNLIAEPYRICFAFAVFGINRTHPSSNPLVCLLSNL